MPYFCFGVPLKCKSYLLEHLVFSYWLTDHDPSQCHLFSKFECRQYRNICTSHRTNFTHVKTPITMAAMTIMHTKKNAVTPENLALKWIETCRKISSRVFSSWKLKQSCFFLVQICLMSSLNVVLFFQVFKLAMHHFVNRVFLQSLWPLEY